MTDPLQISLLGKNALIREGLRHILTREGFDVVESVDDSSRLRHGDRPSVILIVDQGIASYGRTDMAALQHRFPNAQIVLLAETFDFDDMMSAFKAGARGYIIKDIACESLVGSLQLVAMGERVLPGELVDQLPNTAVAPPPAAAHELRDLLSNREIEILRCLVIGYPNKLISRRLDISEATVKVHVKAILRKLKVQNRTQAAIFALHHGLGAGEFAAAPAILEQAVPNVALGPPVERILDHAVAA